LQQHWDGSLVLGECAPLSSAIGLGLAVAALVIMPLLARRKRVIAVRIDSVVRRGDAAWSITCACMAAALLVGLTSNAAVGWWWADSAVTPGLPYRLIPEGCEALEGARAGCAGCACGHDGCRA
jgi:hypothetical protein